MSKFVEVILTLPHEEGFIYSVPTELKNVIRSGQQVIVPFGKKFVTGIILRELSKIPVKLGDVEIRPVSDIVYTSSLIQPELMQLLKWISEYYVCHLGETFRMIHAGLNVGRSKILICRNTEMIPQNISNTQKKILNNLSIGKEISINTLQKKIKRKLPASALLDLDKKGYITRRYSNIKPQKPVRVEEYFRLLPKNNLRKDTILKLEEIRQSKSTKSRLILEYLEKKDWVSVNDLKKNGFSRRTLNKLLSLNMIERNIKAKERLFEINYQESFSKIQLTVEQQKIVDEIEKSIIAERFEKFLLHGITGSGKTQVYIEAIKKVLKQKRQAIVLIPEIILTPQTLTRFRHHFGDKVVVLHSRLSAAEKREFLYRIRQGDFSVVIGPRSAIFAPLNNLGLIVVDEEQESSYKQTDATPHYHARDVAIYRAKLNKAVVILGSATPSFESIYNTRTGNFKYFHLKERIGSRSLPRIGIVDLREEWKKQHAIPVLSDSLELRIESRLLTKEQVMILQNRRGYAPYILCKDCGYVVKCPNCDVTLTYHQSQRNLICHYCGFSETAPDVCPKCQGTDILYKGIGTQRIEEEIIEKFSDTKIIRMDQDTTRGKFSHSHMLEEFRSGKASILLGTKMIAKGLDFKRVSLVGVISADQGLYFPDFRAAEKVFQLLTQAAGRAGRGSSNGEVIIQTLDPNHYVFKYLLTHDYLGFYEKEIQSRQTLRYPPYSRLILIRIEGKSLKEVQKYSESIKSFLWEVNEDKQYGILGPAPSPLARKQNFYRYQILIKQDKKADSSILKLKRILKVGILNNAKVKRWPVKIAIDVDPIDIL